MSNTINTRNESALHQSLKVLYALENGARTEVHLDGKVYDIVDEMGGIIEIQTHNVSSLRGKIETALDNGHKIKVVYPVAATKIIESYTASGELARKTPSPLHSSVYNMWKEITRLVPVLLHPGFSLEVLEIAMTQMRILCETPMQSLNHSRRWLKPWIIADNRLDKVLKTYSFDTAASYLSLLPGDCPPVFRAKDVADALALDKTLPSSAAKQSHYMLWVLSRMGLLERVSNASTKHKGNTKYYKMTKAKA